MCVTAVLAAVAVIGGGLQAASSIQTANTNKASAQYRGKLEQKQATEQRKIAEIQAFQQESAKTDAFSRSRSAALAAIGASGLGEQISFFQGIDVESQAAYLRDVRSVRLNLTQQKSTLAEQVQASAYGVRVAEKNAGSAKLGAIADFIQTAAKAANFAASNATPAPQPAAKVS